MEKIKFTREFWEEWVKNPQATATKYGLDWNQADPAWKGKNWRELSQAEGKELMKKSKWSGWFWWE